MQCFILYKTCWKKFAKIATDIGKTDEKISVYLQIENELISLTQDKKDKESLFSEDYEKAILAPAVERVVGNTLKDIDNDGEFEKKLLELIKIYNHWYYQVAYKYKLPTIRIIPFLVRLISP